MKRTFRELLVAFTAANLFCLRSWSELEIVHSPESYFFFAEPPSQQFGWMLLALIAGLTVAGWGLYQFSYHARNTVLGIAIDWLVAVLFAIILFDLVKWPVSLLSNSGFTYGAFALFVVSNTILAGILCRGRRVALHLFESIILLFSPFAIFKVLETSFQWRSIPVAAMFHDSVERPQPIEVKKPRRIVWILFDEMDQSLAFEARPPSLALPEFDQLSRESIYADHSIPASRFTQDAVLGILTGQMVSGITPSGPSDVVLHYADDGSSRSLKQVPNLFTELRRTGIHTAVAGWYIPYCRLFSSELDRCRWSAMPERTPASLWCEYSASLPVQSGIREMFWRNSSDILRIFGKNLMPSTANRLENEKHELLRARHAVRFQIVRESALAFLTNDDIQFVMVHLPIPHLPAIYDPSSGEIGNFADSTYLDNYNLADRFLGEVRAILKASNQWDQTALLVTSDHSLRPYVALTPLWIDQLNAMAALSHLTYVPFMLKLPGQSTQVRYQAEFNAIVTHDLLVGLGRGEIETADDVSRLLARYSVDQRP